MTPLMIHFEDKADIASAFALTEAEEDWLNSVDILIAADNDDCCDVVGFVLMRDSEGNFWEVNGSHCSCYGYEGQWEPEETTIEALAMRTFGGMWDWGWVNYEHRITAGDMIRERIQLLLRE